VHIDPVFILVHAFDLGFMSMAATPFTICYTRRHICERFGEIILAIIHVVMFVPRISRPCFLKFAKGIKWASCNQARNNYPG
jgi:hypothetical protein